MGFLGVRFGLSNYSVRDKKVLKKWVLGAQLPAHLIEKRIGNRVWG
jgi:hypothetical protein